MPAPELLSGLEEGMVTSLEERAVSAEILEGSSKGTLVHGVATVNQCPIVFRRRDLHSGDAFFRLISLQYLQRRAFRRYGNMMILPTWFLAELGWRLRRGHSSLLKKIDM